MGDFKAVDYTTLFKRIADLDLHIEDLPQSEDMVIVLDSSGVKVTNRGKWVREKWKRRRGWIKVYIAVKPVKKKTLVALEMTDEHTGDSKMFEDLIEQAKENLGKGNIKRVLTDGGYDTKNNFNLLRQKDIESGIKTNGYGQRLSCRRAAICCEEDHGGIRQIHKPRGESCSAK